MHEIVMFIYRHALLMLKPWSDAVIETIIDPQLTSDGFQIIALAGGPYYVGMKESRGTIFVLVNCPTTSFSSMAHDQKTARLFYDKVVDDLLAS